ncbi:glycosyltransferase family 1 protein [Ectobacillus funiculus]|uniref:glycosyltransferase family 1 protein n=1 Tax=Ectobacillus funiculus TaxID=137993 RepID=UPI00397C939E
MGYPLRILHVVVNMNRGGAETLIMNLYRNIDRSKVQFDFLTCKEGVFDAEIEELGGKIHRIPYITEVGHTGYVRALDHFFASHQEYKIVHSHMDKMSGFVLRSAKKAGIPTRIAHSHNISSEGGVVAKAYKWYAGKLILPCATHLLACSNAAAKWLFVDKADTAKVLKNGIECDRFVFSEEIRNQVREELQITRDTFVVGHVGRFTQQKNHTFVIDIFAELVKVKPESILLLVGDGPLRLDIEKKVRELHLEDKVKFLGVRSDIERLLQAFDVFVFPSLFEGLGIVLIEAQASNLMCIASNTVPHEADMGLGLIKFLSLGNTRIWINEMLQTSSRRASDSYIVDMEKKGYDIRETTMWLQQFYNNNLR